MLGFVKADLPGRLEIRLIPNKNNVNCITRIRTNIFEPIDDVCKGLGFCYIKHQDDYIRYSVIACGDGPEPFLASGIPNLQVYLLSVQDDVFDLKVDADRRGIRLFVLRALHVRGGKGFTM